MKKFKIFEEKIDKAFKKVLKKYKGFLEKIVKNFFTKKEEK